MCMGFISVLTVWASVRDLASIGGGDYSRPSVYWKFYGKFTQLSQLVGKKL